MTALHKVRKAQIFCANIGKWLWSMKPLLMMIAAALILPVTFYLPQCLEPRIRLSGMALQLLGVVVAAVGLNDSRRAFNDLPTMWEIIRQEWGARPRWTQNHTLAATGLANAVSIGSARMRVNLNPTLPIEQQIAFLNRQHVELFDEVGRLSGAVEQKFNELTSEMKAERTDREAGGASIRAQLKRAIGEGIRFQIFGVVFFLLGITAGTASQEIARLSWSAACIQ